MAPPLQATRRPVLDAAYVYCIFHKRQLFIHLLHPRNRKWPSHFGSKQRLHMMAVAAHDGSGCT
jgi:hypothetical protein